MIGNNADANNSPSQNNQNDNTNSCVEYLTQAFRACNAGEVVLALHLYLAAYERSLQESSTLNPAAITGLHTAWDLACLHKERSLAEYIFEKLERYLTADETANFAARLQQLALDKLEEFGLNRADLEDMTNMISQDFFGLDPTNFLMRFDRGTPLAHTLGKSPYGLTRSRNTEDKQVQGNVPKEETVDQDKDATVDVGGVEVSPEKREARDSSPKEEPTPNGSQENEKKREPYVPVSDDLAVPSNLSVSDASSATVGKEVSNEMPPLSLGVHASLKTFASLPVPRKPEGMKPDSLKEEASPEKITYRDLVGYETVIEKMREQGIGVGADPLFKELIDTLNERHGLHKIPITDAFLFRSPTREDASQFLVATMEEIGLPTIRMRMEENLQGMPVLCVIASAESLIHFNGANAARNTLEGGAVVILEDLDLWGAPLAESSNEESGGFMQAQLSRGAREAINLIRAAAENPHVYLFVSAEHEEAIDDFFADILEPLTVIDIDYPNSTERADLWSQIAKEHPSLREIDQTFLVEYSSGMSRFDIYMAAREAVEDAYKVSLAAKEYIPVAAENLFEKIAAYQPLESEEYQKLEDAVIAEFKVTLDQLDDVLKGESE